MATVVTLEETLDLQATGRLAGHLSAPLANPGAMVTLDASGVRYLGALAAQLILAAHRSGGAPGRRLTVTQPSAEFALGMARLGIDPQALEG